MDMGDRNIDTQYGTNVVGGATVATENLVVMPSQGTTQFNRTGREVTDVDIEWKWDGVIGTGETGGSPLSLRFVIDAQPNRALPAGGSVAALMYTYNQLSGLTNIDEEQRFFEVDRVDYDCVGSAGPQAWQTEGNFSLVDKLKLFGTGGAITACQDWALYALVYQNGGLVKTTTDTLNVRVRFHVE